eukprot:361155_1
MTITTMNIISPLQRKRHSLTMPSSLPLAKLPMIRTTMCNDEQQLMNDLDVYTIFVLLEKQRVNKLKELYQGKRFESKKCKDITNLLPPFPPRYACLKDLSSEWLVSELKKNQRQRQTLIHKPAMELSTLDQVTKTFLEDAVNILQEEYGTSRNQSPSPSISIHHLPHLNPLSSEADTPDRTTITPPSSPLSLSVVIKDCILTDDRRSEVDMADSEIVRLWNACD